ncbi:MAG: hypothetical protein JWM59_1241 [Verrucomicrobiales bacterium]|nr:hypothetical protein [Verrucomicrobiales bacterium]
MSLQFLSFFRGDKLRFTSAEVFGSNFPNENQWNTLVTIITHF